MSDLMKRLGWTTSLALSAALIGAGCDNRPADEPVIETVEPPAPGAESTDFGDPGMPGDTMPGDTTDGAMTGPEATTPGTGLDAPGTDTGLDDPTTGSDLSTEPEVQPEPAEPGTDEQP